MAAGVHRPRALAEAIAAARRRAGLAVPDGTAAAVEHSRKLLSAWAAAEVAPGRLLPWLPVAFGSGIALYYTAEREPLWMAAIGAAIVAIAIAFIVRRSSIAFPAALAAAAIAAGFALATLQTMRIAHPVLQFPVSSASITGFIEVREERARSDRVVIRVREIDGRRMPERPERVRVAVRKNSAPPVGAFVGLKANLSPPLQPLRPGGYDFARGMYFQQIGASGYALGAIKVSPAPAQPGLWLRYATIIDSMREGIDNRIRAQLPDDRGSIASALITGKRDAISPAVNDAMYSSSLAHVLSISGYHMAVVSGIVFFVIRAVLALMHSLASRRPIKKWAAAGALSAAAFYLVLSGAEVATQRSFIMIAIVLLGVLVDRSALTFRTLAVAAFVVLALAPESLVHPSFQMSFAATLALVAAYQNGLPWHTDAESSLQARVALWGGREIAGLVLASLVAGLATTLYAAFHFHRIAPYGVLANLAAMPVVSALVMPMGILGVLAMPFGFDSLFWQLMGYGIDWMTGVALWVTGLPGAVGRMAAFGSGPLLLGTAGLLLICLLRTPLRWSGAVLAVIASLWAVAAPKPDVLISGEGQAAAVRGPDGRLSLLHAGRDTFAVKEWLAADGDPRMPKDLTLSEGVRCDDVGCIGRLKDGRRVSFVRAVEAFAEDCNRAAVVLSAREAQASCAARLIDRKVWLGQGATALRWTGERFEVEAARPPGTDRPWARARSTPATTGTPPQRPTVRDAAPRPEDLEADD